MARVWHVTLSVAITLLDRAVTSCERLNGGDHPREQAPAKQWDGDDEQPGAEPLDVESAASSLACSRLSAHVGHEHSRSTEDCGEARTVVVKRAMV